jgi:hypothetical protein
MRFRHGKVFRNASFHHFAHTLQSLQGTGFLIDMVNWAKLYYRDGIRGSASCWDGAVIAVLAPRMCRSRHSPTRHPLELDGNGVAVFVRIDRATSSRVVKGKAVL